ncbi:MAG: hypothetical protein WDM91_05345 [Rhizomicrobium sp.]
MKIARAAALAAVLGLAGCASYSAIDGGKPVLVGNNVTVTPQINWGKAPFPGFTGTLWTEDGISLDSLMFFTGIEPGKPLIDVAGVPKNEVKVYQASMVPDDVMELLSANFGKLGYQQIRTSNLRPAAFGAAPGFRFDLTFSSADGLDMKGMAIFAQRGGKLDMILFIAPVEYYYDHYGPTVEKIFGSVQTAGN